MITNDTVIEINGVALEAIDYPSGFLEDGGFTTRVVSRDSRLEQLMAPGTDGTGDGIQFVLTNLRNAPMAFTR